MFKCFTQVVKSYDSSDILLICQLGKQNYWIVIFF